MRNFGNLFSSVSILLVFTSIIPILLSCKDEVKPAKSSNNLTMMNDTLLNYNKGVLKMEDQEIEDFLARYKWKVNRTQTGLRYFIYKSGTGPKAVLGKKALFSYEIRLINGDLCYSSKEKGNREIELGRSSGENGLQEGILLMRRGDRAKFIVPSHLAFGLLGDQDKIPPQSTLIYDIELIQLK